MQRSTINLSMRIYGLYRGGAEFVGYGREPSDLQWHQEAASRVYQLLFDDIYGPYATLSTFDLAQCLKQRQIPLPKVCDKRTYASALQNADTGLRFRFLDLPKDIRLQVYDSALLIDMDENLCINHGPPQMRRKLSKAPLLQTCRQIRLEGAAIFYGMNRFPLECNESFDREYAEHPRHNFTSITLSWLSMLTDTDPEAIRQFRHITLKISCCSSHHQNYIDIDLNDRNARQWIIRERQIPPSYMTWAEGVCRVLKLLDPVPLAQWSKVENDLSHEYDKMKHIPENIVAADAAVTQLWSTCGDGGRTIPTIEALNSLSVAVQEILDDMCFRARVANALR